MKVVIQTKPSIVRTIIDAYAVKEYNDCLIVYREINGQIEGTGIKKEDLIKIQVTV